MTIKSLANTSFEDLLECFLLAFENYFVPMPQDANYYKKRWEASKVDFTASYGMFDGEQLVGFIIHAIDNRASELTAFNTATGVVPAYRGRKIVNSIYEHAIPELISRGIKRIQLEVITKNVPAIQAYKKIGFKINKKYHCFEGEIKESKILHGETKHVDFADVNWALLPDLHQYSWDFQEETIIRGAYSFYYVLRENYPESYFIINKETFILAQFDILQPGIQVWKRLFATIRDLSKSIRIINVDDLRQDKFKVIKDIGLRATVDQFEMELILR